MLVFSMFFVASMFKRKAGRELHKSKPCRSKRGTFIRALSVCSGAGGSNLVEIVIYIVVVILLSSINQSTSPDEEAYYFRSTLESVDVV